MGATTLYGGHCVVDGPFANTMRHWLYQQNGENDWKMLASPHCLSRGFTTTNYVDELHSRISPEQVEETLRQENYSEFFIRLENSTHNAIPQFIMGDFYSFTAPNGMATVSCSSSFANNVIRPSILFTPCPSRSLMVDVAAKRPRTSITRV